LRLNLKVLGFQCFPNTVTFLANSVIAVTAPKRIHNRIKRMPVTRRTENLNGVLIGVVAITVPATFKLRHLAASHIDLFSKHIWVTLKAFAEPLGNCCNHDGKNHQSLPNHHNVSR